MYEYSLGYRSEHVPSLHFKMSLCSWWSKFLLEILLDCFVLFISNLSSTLKLLRGRKNQREQVRKKILLKSLRACVSLEASISLFLSQRNSDSHFLIGKKLREISLWRQILPGKNSHKSVCRATRKGGFLRSMKADSYQNPG